MRPVVHKFCYTSFPVPLYLWRVKLVLQHSKQSKYYGQHQLFFLHWAKIVQIRSFYWSEYRKLRNRKNSAFGHFSLNAYLIPHRRIGWTFYISSYHGKKSRKFPEVAVGCQNRKLTYTFLVSKICENGLFLGWYLLDQSQQWKYQNNVWNLFTVYC